MLLWGERFTRRRRVLVGLVALFAVLDVALGFAVLAIDTGRAAPVPQPLHPIAGEFVPDHRSIVECHDERCFQQAFGNLAYEEGPRVALELADRLYGEERSAACHRVVHLIGAAALARNGGDVARTFAEGSPACWSGYYHGVLERSLVGVSSREPEALAAVARTLCVGVEHMVPWIRYQCLHGLGHGLMITTGLGLPLSLDVCRRLATRWERDACRGGVFMENMSTSYGYRSSWLDDADPVYPCNAVARANRFRCYQLVTSRILPATGDDWARTAERCSRVEPDFIAVCFQSLGRDASSRSNRRASDIVRTCAVARSFEHEGDCIVGAAMDITSNDMSPSRTAILCGTVKGELRARCYFGLGATMGRFRSTHGERVADCAAVAPAPRYVAECLRGGATTLPRS